MDISLNYIEDRLALWHEVKYGRKEIDVPATMRKLGEEFGELVEAVIRAQAGDEAAAEVAAEVAEEATDVRACASSNAADCSVPVPRWATAEVRAAWDAARAANGQTEAFRILERMVDRIGYGRTDNNPPIY